MFPTILERMLYDKKQPGTVEKVEYFVKMGYIFMAQDCVG
jgi:hypothetical protein